MVRRCLFVALFSLFFATVLLAVSCSQVSETGRKYLPRNPFTTVELINEAPVMIGYSNWAGWWPWAIAASEGLFVQNGVNVELKWFDSYIASMEALAAGELDGNSQTLNDTISFAADAVEGEVAVLVNDNSAGNDKIVVSAEIETIDDLLDKAVAIEEGVVCDFLLSLALEEAGHSREDVEILGMDTGDAANAFLRGDVDAAGVFSPYWLTALAREGSQELVSSEAFPGAIPDLLVVTQTLIDEQPAVVQALVNTWFDVLTFMVENPEKSDAIMAERAGITVSAIAQLKAGTQMFTLAQNLEAFHDDYSMQHLPYAARKMAAFMVNVGFIDTAPSLEPLLEDQFVQAYAEAQELDDRDR